MGLIFLLEWVTEFISLGCNTKLGVSDFFERMLPSSLRIIFVASESDWLLSGRATVNWLESASSLDKVNLIHLASLMNIMKPELITIH